MVLLKAWGTVIWNPAGTNRNLLDGFDNDKTTSKNYHFVTPADAGVQ